MRMARAFHASSRQHILAPSCDTRDVLAAIVRQHFLKGALSFLISLLYFQSRASRFPSCTQQLKAISLHQEGNMAKKAKKAKSAVKKTAKKVSKKKK